MTVYTTALGKGGVAKTTTAAELAWWLAHQGRFVLAIDLDQQGNLSARCGVTDDTELATLRGRTLAAADVLTGEADPAEAAIDAPEMPGVKVLVGTHDLTRVETSPPPDLVTSLRDVLPGVRGTFTDVVIDTPPSLGGLTLAGLAAADVVIAPVAMEAEAYQQVDRLAQVIEQALSRRVRPGLRIGWVIPTRYDGRQVVAREVVELLGEKYPGHVTNPIREAVAVKESFIAGQTISAYRPGSHPAHDYAAAFAAITRQEALT